MAVPSEHCRQAVEICSRREWQRGTPNYDSIGNAFTRLSYTSRETSRTRSNIRTRLGSSQFFSLLLVGSYIGSRALYRRSVCVRRTRMGIGDSWVLLTGV